MNERVQNRTMRLLMTSELINDLRQIIDSARSHVAATANYEVTMMNWNIGNRINRDVLNYERAEYGKQIVAQVATKLSWSHFIEVLPLKEPLLPGKLLTYVRSTI